MNIIIDIVGVEDIVYTIVTGKINGKVTTLINRIVAIIIITLIDIKG
jgi:hypothetical protein